MSTYNPNHLVIALAQNKETFIECRKFIETIFEGDKFKVIQLEQTRIEIGVPYYIKFLEYKGINILEALNHFHYEIPDADFNTLLNASIVNVFRKLEKKEVTFTSF